MHNLLSFKFERTGSVCLQGFEGLDAGNLFNFMLLLSEDQSFKMPLLSSLDDGGGRVPGSSE